MADAPPIRTRGTPMLKLVLALSAAALALSGGNTAMILSERTASRELTDRLEAAERARQQEVTDAARLRREQEEGVSRAMRFR